MIASPRLWVTFAIVVSLFTLTGPFGTLDRLNAWMRFGYWLAVHAFAWATAIGLSLIAERLLAAYVSSPLTRMMIGSGVAALPIALEVEWLNGLVLPVRPDPGHFLSNLLVTLPLSLLFCLLTYMTLGRDQEEPPQPEPAIGAARPEPSPAPPGAGQPAAVPLLKRLRPENRGRLVRLEAEDHYTRVVTTAGNELVLLRFADALAELGPAPGLKVHRSHWVASDQVTSVLRDGGRLMLIATDGVAVPVSRAQAQALKDQLRDLPQTGAGTSGGR
nr:LytTR family DNA-binding domain-containing protein [Gellertiella hungarica]